MPKVSATTTAKVDDFGVATDRNDELDGYVFSFVSPVSPTDRNSEPLRL